MLETNTAAKGRGSRWSAGSGCRHSGNMPARGQPGSTIYRHGTYGARRPPTPSRLPGMALHSSMVAAQHWSSDAQRNGCLRRRMADSTGGLLGRRQAAARPAAQRSATASRRPTAPQQLGQPPRPQDQLALYNTDLLPLGSCALVHSRSQRRAAGRLTTCTLLRPRACRSAAATAVPWRAHGAPCFVASAKQQPPPPSGCSSSCHVQRKPAPFYLSSQQPGVHAAHGQPGPAARRRCASSLRRPATPRPACAAGG
jgi:hypothetical protein